MWPLLLKFIRGQNYGKTCIKGISCCHGNHIFDIVPLAISNRILLLEWCLHKTLSTQNFNFAVSFITWVVELCWQQKYFRISLLLYFFQRMKSFHRSSCRSENLLCETSQPVEPTEGDDTFTV